VQYFTLFPEIYCKLGHRLTKIEIARIIISANYFSVYIKCQITELQCANITIYSASVCAKSVIPILPKLDYIMQYFMLFPMVYSKLGHKLANVKTARINKVVIAFVYIITLRKLTSIFRKRLPQNLSSPSVPELDYIVQYFMLFLMMLFYCTVNWGRSSPTSKRQGLITIIRC
jgi:hypothetical protein